MQRASQQTDQTSAKTAANTARGTSVAQLPFLAADVGGTHARIGLIQGRADGSLSVMHYRKFACADYPALSDILREFVRDIDATAVSHACIACAGYVLGDVLINANLPWQVSISAIRERLDLEHVSLVNDFEAVAYAAHFHDEASSPLIAGSGDIRSDRPRLIVGPGTGLGAAVLLPREPRPGILATEAGHAALAPRTLLELQIVRRLGNGAAHVPNERVLSGTGLATLYRALGELHSAPTPLSMPAQITAAALAGGDALATECVEVFCAWLGSMVGDLVLLYGAHGGVFLAGGVLPQILPLLQRSAFAERFYGKGMLRELLERTPVRLIEHGQLGVTGAAHWYLDRHLAAGKAPGDSKNARVTTESKR